MRRREPLDAVGEDLCADEDEHDRVGEYRIKLQYVPEDTLMIAAEEIAYSFAEGLEGPAAYSITKAALNALTLKFAQVADGRLEFLREQV